MITEKMIHDAETLNHVNCEKCGTEMHVEEASKLIVPNGPDDVDCEPVCADCALEIQIKFEERGY